MNTLNILRKTCSLICIFLLLLVFAILIFPFGAFIGYLTIPLIGHTVNFAIGWWIGGTEWFHDIIYSIWNFKYD